jgi:uncharacterized membrane protein YkvA (DUF1232 family)
MDRSPDEGATHGRRQELNMARFPGLPLFRWFRAVYHLPNYARLFWRLWNDPRVPIYRKAIPVLFAILCMGVAALYVAAKVDAIPDFFGPIGRVDDLLVVLFLLFAPGAWVFVRLCPPEVVAEHVRAIDEAHRRRGPL